MLCSKHNISLTEKKSFFVKNLPQHETHWQSLCYRDAAHRLHPLAGQGVNLGFGDVSCLSRLLAEAVQSGSDVGSLYYLTKYETERQRAVLPVVMTIHGLHYLYNTDFSPVVLLRSLGLQSTNALQFVKVWTIILIFISSLFMLLQYSECIPKLACMLKPRYQLMINVTSFV